MNDDDYYEAKERAIAWEMAMDDRDDEINELRKALAFAASVIKSGEGWSETCDEIIGGALEADA
jgi:hypothetical protein